MTTNDERRNARRFALSVDVKFLLRGVDEGAGMLLDISETGLALLSDADAKENDPIVVYPLGLGRIEGTVVRRFEGGVGISFALSQSQKESLRTRIEAALEGRTYMRLVEKRSDLRIRYNIETTAWIEGLDAPAACTIVDMSKSGCLLRSEASPSVGADILVGALRGKVSRRVDDGFAVRFETVKNAAYEENAA
ncbi:MAG: PilZ domain-containing protein [Oricola sp.]|jgi:hypothetical protein|nr:PilZ domain-containing protein [Oricola sp.]